MVNLRRRRMLSLAASLPLATTVAGQAPGRTHVVGYWGTWNAPGKP
jgi:hypothetical protein